MKKKLLISGLSLLLVIVVGLGVVLVPNVVKKNNKFKETYATNILKIKVKEEYKDMYFNEEFAIEDFKWKNIDKIEYNKWYEYRPEMSIYVYLKHPGVGKVKRAYKKFESLYFVSEVSYCVRITTV